MQENEHTVRKCFFKFKSEPNSKSLTTVFRLYSDKYPKTVNNFLKLCTGTSSAQNKENRNDKTLITYKKSKVTRIISPEYIIQCGEISHRSNQSILNAETYDNFIDKQEYDNYINETADSLYSFRRGLLCLVSDPYSGPIPKTNSNYEFFITLITSTKQEVISELEQYMVIGEIDISMSSKSEKFKGIDRLIEWFNVVSVDDRDRPSENCFVYRCGELVKVVNDRDGIKDINRTLDDESKAEYIEKEDDHDYDMLRAQQETTTDKDKVNAFDALYGSESAKRFSSLKESDKKRSRR